MSNRINEINTTIKNIPDVKIIKPFEESETSIQGCVSVFTEGLDKPLEFEVTIEPQYPIKSHDVEGIKFYNIGLIEYSHIMSNGSICINTPHTPVLWQKLVYDFDSVKAWIKKYYIDKDIDTHYEHLIIHPKVFKESHFAYFFNEVDYTFRKNQYGLVDYSALGNGFQRTTKVHNNILQKFRDRNNKEIIDVKWNGWLKSLPTRIGLFIFIQVPPSNNNRFGFENWKDFEMLLPQEFLNFLHTVEKSLYKHKGEPLPLFIGYNITEKEIHWQVIMLEIGDFPIEGKKINQQWLTLLEGNRSIDWGITRNCSYEYFFGRGKLCDTITNGKLLIIGIGAIGSIVAKTLVRCGCKRVDFLDYDVKEPENICRSEYSFATGINNKTSDLANELYMLSPFFETEHRFPFYSDVFEILIKSHLTDTKMKSDLEKYLNEYDLIIDCTADNDLLYVLSRININPLLLNLSISNHAKHLVCAAEDNRYDFVMNQFDNILKFDIDDLHNPTGCWSPTFKASYNDINTLVQFAIKHVNLRFMQESTLRNFVIETDDTDCFTIKLKEF